MSDSMRDKIKEELTALNSLINEYGGVDSYTTTQATTLFTLLCKIMYKLGLNPEDRADFFEGSRIIFNLQFINMDDYTHGRYIFVPNHVSEFDGLLFGTIIPNILVVAKSEWVSNPHLNGFIGKLFSVVGLIRKDSASGMNVLRKCVEHLKSSPDSAVTIFAQQTIADIEATKPEDVASGAFYIAKRAEAQIVPVYYEQVSTEEPTRIVFGSPIVCTNKNEFGEAWLRSEMELRDSISDPGARPPVLCEKHRKPISEREF